MHMHQLVWIWDAFPISPVFATFNLGLAMAGEFRSKEKGGGGRLIGLSLVMRYASVFGEIVLMSVDILDDLHRIVDDHPLHRRVRRAFRAFAARFPFTITLLTVLSSFQAVVMVRCLGSGIMGIPQTNAPMSSAFWHANRLELTAFAPRNKLQLDPMATLLIRTKVLRDSCRDDPRPPTAHLQLYVLARGDVHGAVAVVTALLTTACFLSNCVAKGLLIALLSFKEGLLLPTLEQVVVVSHDELLAATKKAHIPGRQDSGVGLDCSSEAAALGVVLLVPSYILEVSSPKNRKTVKIANVTAPAVHSSIAYPPLLRPEAAALGVVLLVPSYVLL
ncbi:hypothetical protein BDK51DRAFT_25886 [Blyttiomyces helicus]|uniref:Uncharacterized protein n=1 Tax=Blyttiomyces helicus TaxID=388810 RepID=A0A4P9VXR3_9FUNG|nr:hypothetical protein BDK51DRAFT_25886 [Blyttiomyces helicus]|eukprot:RKO83090.1 hypothetical protein BDK51DRAFT_25886 [Blyttiomyces helicus]